MSDHRPSRALTTTRDWARNMAATTKPIPAVIGPTGPVMVMPTDEERVLWRQIADEIDAFINGTGPDIEGQLELTPPSEPRDPAVVGDDEEETL